jgi:hypothetical protein
MKRAGIAAALATIVACIWYLQRPQSSPAAPGLPPPRLAAREGSTAAATTPANAAHAGIGKVARLASLEERQSIAKRIADAQAARGAVRAAPRPTLPSPEPAPAVTLSKVEIREAMREVIPHLRECYEKVLPTLADSHVKLTAKLRLTGDPDVGTLIDADALADANGKPLPATFDDCLRSTFMMMALPPLAEGNTLEVHYPFVFKSE